MRISKYAITLLFLLPSHKLFPQSVNYAGWEIRASDLTNGVLVFNAGQTKTIMYNVSVQRFMTSSGGWNNVIFSFQLFRQPEGATLGNSIPLTDIKQIDTSQFPEGAAIDTKQFSLTLTAGTSSNTQLRNNDKILLVVAGPWSPSKDYFVSITSSGNLGPANLTAEAVSSSEILLKWTDRSNNECAFTVSYNGKLDVIRLAKNTTEYVHENLRPNTKYEYHVCILVPTSTGNCGSVHACSNTARATTLMECPENVTYSSPTNVFTTKAVNLIETTGNFSFANNRIYTFLAGNEITLKPNTHLHQGVTFTAGSV